MLVVFYYQSVKSVEISQQYEDLVYETTEMREQRGCEDVYVNRFDNCKKATDRRTNRRNFASVKTVR